MGGLSEGYGKRQSRVHGATYTAGVFLIALAVTSALLFQPALGQIAGSNSTPTPPPPGNPGVPLPGVEVFYNNSSWQPPARFNPGPLIEAFNDSLKPYANAVRDFVGVKERANRTLDNISSAIKVRDLAALQRLKSTLAEEMSSYNQSRTAIRLRGPELEARFQALISGYESAVAEDANYSRDVANLTESYQNFRGANSPGVRFSNDLEHALAAVDQILASENLTSIAEAVDKAKGQMENFSSMFATGPHGRLQSYPYYDNPRHLRNQQVDLKIFMVHDDWWEMWNPFGYQINVWWVSAWYGRWYGFSENLWLPAGGATIRSYPVTAPSYRADFYTNTYVYWDHYYFSYNPFDWGFKKDDWGSDPRFTPSRVVAPSFITRVYAPSTVDLGRTATFTYSFENVGDATATQVDVYEYVPAGFSPDGGFQYLTTFYYVAPGTTVGAIRDRTAVQTGTWTIGGFAWYYDGVNPGESTQAYTSVGVIVPPPNIYNIFFVANPDRPKVDGPFTLFGQVNNRGGPATVDMSITDLATGQVFTKRDSAPIDGSTMTVAQSKPTVGTYRYRFSAYAFNSGGTSSASAETTVTVTPLATFLGLGSDRTEVFEGDSVRFTAQLIDEFSRAVVGGTISFRDDLTGAFIGSASTDGSGFASILYTIGTPGTHTLRATFSGNAKYTSSPDATTAVQVKSKNRLPTLSGGSVSPSSGDTATQFTYSVTYADPDNDAPAVKSVYIDGSPRTMTYVSGTYTGGALFRYQTTLAEGSHSFYFYFEDGRGGTVSTGTLSGPTVSVRDTSPPTITDITRSQKIPKTTEDVEVAAIVDDPSGVAAGSVKLFYSVNGGSWTTPQDPMKLIGGKYRGTIPRQSAGATVAYNIQASDNKGNSGTSATESYRVATDRVLAVLAVQRDIWSDNPPGPDTSGMKDITNVFNGAWYVGKTPSWFAEKLFGETAGHYYNDLTYKKVFFGFDVPLKWYKVQTTSDDIGLLLADVVPQVENDGYVLKDYDVIFVVQPKAGGEFAGYKVIDGHSIYQGNVGLQEKTLTDDKPLEDISRLTHELGHYLDEVTSGITGGVFSTSPHHDEDYGVIVELPNKLSYFDPAEQWYILSSPRILGDIAKPQKIAPLPIAPLSTPVTLSPVENGPGNSRYAVVSNPTYGNQKHYIEYRLKELPFSVDRLQPAVLVWQDFGRPPPHESSPYMSKAFRAPEEWPSGSWPHLIINVDSLLSDKAEVRLRVDNTDVAATSSSPHAEARVLGDYTPNRPYAVRIVNAYRTQVFQSTLTTDAQGHFTVPISWDDPALEGHEDLSYLFEMYPSGGLWRSLKPFTVIKADGAVHWRAQSNVIDSVENLPPSADIREMLVAPAPVKIGLKLAGNVDVGNYSYTIYMDTTDTGVGIDGLVADYKLVYSSEGAKLYRYSQNSWVEVKAPFVLGAHSENSIELAISSNSIGSPSQVKMVAHSYYASNGTLIDRIPNVATSPPYLLLQDVPLLDLRPDRLGYIPGETVTISGFGFPPNSKLEARFVDADGVEAWRGDVHTGTDGSINFAPTWTIPQNTAGTFRVVWASTEMGVFNVGPPSDVGQPGVDATLSPAFAAVSPGEPAIYKLSVTNKDTQTQTFDASVSGVDPSWISLTPPSVTIDPGKTAESELRVTPSRSCTTKPGTYNFSVNIVSKFNPQFSTAIHRGRIGVLPYQEVMTTLSPTYDTVKPLGSASYILSVENRGNVYGTYLLSTPGLEAAWRTLVPDVTLQACGTAQVPLTVTPPYCTAPSRVSFNVSAVQSGGKASGLAPATLQVEPILFDASARETAYATYSPAGQVLGRTTYGTLAATNRESFSVPYVDARLRNINATSLPSATVHADNLRPGENTIATYTVDKDPRLRLSGTWRTLTLQDYVAQLRAQGNLTEAGERAVGDLDRKLLFGRDNIFEASLVLTNTDTAALHNVTLTDLIPASILDAQLVQGPGQYDATSDTLRLGEVGPYSTVSLLLRGRVPKEALPAPTVDSLGLPRSLNATYDVDRTLSGLEIQDLGACVFTQNRTYRSDEAASLSDPSLGAVGIVKEVRVEADARENASGTDDASGRLLASSATGRLNVTDLESYAARGGVTTFLNNTTATDLVSPVVAGLLEPGPNTIASYAVHLSPRLRISQEWSDPSFVAYLDQVASEGRISPQTAGKMKEGRKLLFGSDNTLEFNVTLRNPSLDALRNVALHDPAPPQAASVRVLEPAGLAYDPAARSVSIGDLGPGANVTVRLQAILPASAFPDPSADDVDLRPNTTVTYAVNDTLSGLRVSDVVGNDFFLVLLGNRSYRTDEQVSLRDDSLSRVTITKPLRTDASIVETVRAAYNASGNLTESDVRGRIALNNRESYPGRLGFTVQLDNVSPYTTLPSVLSLDTFPQLQTLRSGDNEVVTYPVSRDPRLRLALEWNTTFGTRLRYNYNETFTLRVLGNNTAPDTLNNLSFRVGADENLTRCCEMGVEPVTPGLAYDNATRLFTYNAIVQPNSTFTLEARVHLRPTNPDLVVNRTVLVNFNATVTYDVNRTLSGVAFRDIVGNDHFLVLKESQTHATLANLGLRELLKIDVLTRLVLAFRTDSANAQFVDGVAQARPDIYIVNVSMKAGFFSELRSRFYNVLWLANTGSDTEAEEQLTDSEVAEVQALVKAGSPIGRGLIVSGFGLKYEPDLGTILGVNYRGSLPMGNRFEVRPVEVLVDHNITHGLVDQRLEATSWFVRAEATRASVLARLADGVLPGLRLGVPFWQQQLPALSASIYGNGSGVLFAPDTGTSWQSGHSPQAWLNLTVNAIDWVPVAQGAEAQLDIDTKFSPDHVTARQNANGDQSKNVQVNVTLRNTGPSALFNLQAVEILPAGFVLREGALNASFPSLAPDASASFAYSVEVPASEAADFFLNTTVTALDSQGVAHLFSGGATLSVQLPPGAVCVDPQDHPGKGEAKGKAKKCEQFFVPSGGNGGGKPDCPPGWLKHSETGACEQPGQGNGGGNGNGNGNGNGQGSGGGNGNGNGNGNGKGGGK